MELRKFTTRFSFQKKSLISTTHTKFAIDCKLDAGIQGAQSICIMETCAQRGKIEIAHSELSRAIE